MQHPIAALLIAVALHPSAQAQVYRCTAANGATVLSDKECENGLRKDGHGWVSVEQDQRQRAEDAQSRIRAAEKARQQREQQDRVAAEAALARLRSQAQSSEGQARQIDRLTSYGVLIGRAVGCGVPTESESRRVGRWMDVTFTAAQRALYMPVLVEGIRHHAQQQRLGKAPDTCAQVTVAFARAEWP